jgi:SAM-dependent methyltransferase
MLTCRFCKSELRHLVVDLGHQPPSNAYLDAEHLHAPEQTFPLCAYVCDACWLVQLPDHGATSALFGPDYAYFSSVSKSWLAHAEAFVSKAFDRFDLSPDSFVAEAASNDGYLLQYVRARGARALGIEPTASTAAAARAKGIETVELFLGAGTGATLADEYGRADLVVANNVLAHVPDPADFVQGIAALLAADGVASFEFPHLLALIRGAQFDTIYHEHFSYLSLIAAQGILSAAGLDIFDVERITTHGGSLRVFACHAGARQRQGSVAALLHEEDAAGMRSVGFYTGLQEQAERIKDDLLTWLLEAKRAGRRVAGYGAAAKGNTLLNFAGIRADLLPFVCDAAPSKQGRFLPGSHIPIRAPEALDDEGIDAVLILPWNIADEVIAALPSIRTRGGRFFTAVPELRER